MLQLRQKVLRCYVIVAEVSEAAQARMKGLEQAHPVVPPPRPPKDVNVFQNNQVKLSGKADKAPLDLKSNNLKAKSHGEKNVTRHAAMGTLYTDLFSPAPCTGSTYSYAPCDCSLTS